ncbi:hypothetical protein AADR41_16040, partial [Streptomyces sp. CLV115]|uniref:hypothetical protein n=1 Tax=Streptomyces sp. CLV115 TaxID=3138502 RepID=UPI00313D9F4F
MGRECFSSNGENLRYGVPAGHHRQPRREASTSTIITGGRVRTLDPSAPEADALVLSGVGTSAVLGRGFTTDGAIIAEPTGAERPLIVMPATPSVLITRIAVTGRSAHASAVWRAGGQWWGAV